MRVHLQHFVQPGPGFLLVFGHQVELGHLDAGIEILGVEGGGALKLFEGGTDVTIFQIEFTELVPGIGMFRVNLDDVSQLDNGSLDIVIFDVLDCRIEMLLQFVLGARRTGL